MLFQEFVAALNVEQKDLVLVQALRLGKWKYRLCQDLYSYLQRP